MKRTISCGRRLGCRLWLSCLAAVAAHTASAGTQVEYIQGDGSTGRIVTDFTPNPQTDKIVAEFELAQRNKTCTIWCMRGASTTTATWTLFWVTSGNFRYDYNTSTDGAFGSSAVAGTRYTVTAENNVLTWSGGTGKTHTQVTSFTATGGPLVLFASYWNGTGNNKDNWSNHKLYSFKIYRSGTLIHDLVPTDDGSGNGTLVDTCANPLTVTREGTFACGDPVGDLRISLQESVFYHDGTAKEPTVTVTSASSGTTLTKDTDYTVSYANNVNPGTATVTVTGIDDYEGESAQKRFVIRGVYRVKPDVTVEGTGLSWSSPMSLTNAVACAAAGDKILLKAGEYVLAKQLAISKPIDVKGGYAGTDDTTLAADAMSYLNAYDNSAFASAVAVTTATGAGTSNVFERLCFTRGHQRGLYKSGAANIVFRDCRFYQNNATCKLDWGQNGGACCIDGNASCTATFDGCLFDDNVKTNKAGGGNSGRNNFPLGAALYAASLKRLTLDSCKFLTNGVWFVKDISSEVGQDVGGGIVYVSSSPVTVRDCEFRGNRSPARDDRGGILKLVGTAYGNAITNCIFAGNEPMSTWGSYANGAIDVQFDNAACDVDIYASTIAYNLGSPGKNAAGLIVNRGTVRVRNTIIYGNRCPTSHTANYGVDVAVYENGWLDIDHSLVTASDILHISSYTASHLTCGEHVVYGDPRFELSLDDVTALTSGCYFQTASHATVLALDLHEGGNATGYSKAIDGGTGAYSAEPSPNGGVRNIGLYGNTASAHASTLGVPELAAENPVISFADDARATVSVTLAGDTDYNAFVRVEIATNDFEQGATALQEVTAAARQSGETVSLTASDLYRPGDTLYVRVSVSAPGEAAATQTFYAHKTITGTLPYYFGHGGGASVMHVRAGAEGKATGADWTDAFPDIRAALLAMTSAKTEIWIAGTLKPSMAVVSFSPAAPLVIRGGFHGDEDTLADRPDGTYATLDGQLSYDVMSLNNAAANPVTIERVIFTRGTSRGLYKTGAGNLDVIDCKFLGNSLNNTSSTGRGLCLDGGTRVSVSNCVFRGNYMSGSGSSSSKGGGIYAASVGRLYLDDSIFVTNGCNPACGYSGSMSGRDQCGGGLLLLYSPVTARNCTFLANRTPIRADGGAIWLTGSGSAFTNCVFAGNQSTYAEGDMTSNGGSATGGAITINVSGTVDFEHCTLAYNLGDALHVPGGLNIVAGNVRMHNSIVCCNTRGKLSDVGSDIAVKGTSTLTLSYCRLTEQDGTTGLPSSDTVSVASGATLNCEGLTFGEPNFVTSLADYTSYVVRNGDYSYFKYDTAAARNFTANMDVHLLSPKGYWKNDGNYYEDAETCSGAIDAGDPASPYDREPSPNGGCANLGAYGNTEHASKTSVVTPVVGGIDISFPDGITQPKYVVRMTGENPGDVYSATVSVLCYTGAVESAGVTFSAEYQNILNGQAITNFPPWCYDPGVALTIKVTVSANGVSPFSVTQSSTVTGQISPYFGKGGGDGILHVRVGATGLGDGSDWFNAVDDFARVAKVYGGETEIWFAATNYTDGTLDKALTATAPLTLRGGFIGLENSADARPAGAKSVLDATNRVSTILSIANGAAYPLHLERLVFRRAKAHGLVKSGAGSMTAVDCDFLNNGKTATWNYGRGVNVSGSASATTVAFTNCTFAGNIYAPGYDERNIGGGYGLHAATLARLVLDGCTFVSNGIAGQWPDTGDGGWAFYAGDAPVTARNCRFAGNRGICRDYSSTYMGGCVRLDGACGGSAFTNCAWLANFEDTGTTATRSGTLVVNLSSTAATVDVKSCTFAYNFANGSSASGGINVYKGAVTIRDSILWKNAKGASAGDAIGSEIDLKANGSVDLDWSIVTSTDGGVVHEVTEGTLTVGANVLTAVDPMFVTPTATGAGFVNSARTSFTGSWAKWAAVDCHLLSPAGYVLNDGTEGPATETISGALDQGDTNSVYAAEPAFNGYRINLGAYGNTCEASRTPVGRPSIEKFDVAYSNGWSRPWISATFGLASGSAYSASVTITCATGGVTVASKTFVGVVNGDTVVFAPSVYFPAGTVVDASVVATAPNAEPTSATDSHPASGTFPPWAGKGGGADIVHVRDGADGQATGLDWTDAYPNLGAALAQLVKTGTGAYREVWVTATSAVPSSLLKLTVAGDFVLRGGFRGWETDASARPSDVRTLLDGGQTNDLLRIENAAGRSVTLERFDFRRAKAHGLVKSGAGDLTVADCLFLNNAKTATSNYGRGANVSGSASATTVAFTNCTFAGNIYAPGYDERNIGGGYGLHAATLARLVLDGCTFVSNGIAGQWPDTGDGGWAFYAGDAPVTARNCRFAGNRGICRDYGTTYMGGCVRLDGACGGSAFTNCAWLANFEDTGTTATRSGTLVVNLSSAAATVDVKSCTFAYNFANGSSASGGINVYKGAVTIRDSILWKNTKGASAGSAIGAEIDLKANGSVDLDWSLVTATGEGVLHETTEGSLTVGENVLSAVDPLLVTPTATGAGFVNSARSSFTGSWAKWAAVDAHLRGKQGYLDEVSGREVYWRGEKSPALSAADPASPRPFDPLPHTGGGNLGCYGNTPYATRSGGGTRLLAR